MADLSGVPFMRVSTLMWRGVVPEGEAVGPTDVGAFRWVLPAAAARHTPLGGRRLWRGE